MPRLSKIGAAALAAFGWTGLSTVSASYLVVGGGAGGGSQGGGGGAGGYQTSTVSLNPTLSYTVTVGAGGAGAASTSVTGTSGSSSIFSALTSTGGGGGGSRNSTSGVAGASGGGGAYGSSGGTGTAGQGNNGGGSSIVSAEVGGGGGGASAVGGTGSGTTSGNGGAGSASSISGTSTTYAGGGGGGGYAGSGSITPGSGGSGGGGAGGTSTGSGASGSAGTAGTANLGGGGGGGGAKAGTSYEGGNGGSGVVIISYVGAQQFGGGVVTSSGGNTIHTFTTSGTLSPLSQLSASYLVVAGGGGGAKRDGAMGGGGGAGGLLSGSGLTIDTNSIYLVTVGSGGAAAAADLAAGTNGGNSLFSAYATTALGGGGGGPANSAGLSGGSGGGGSHASGGGGAGTAGQGNNGGAVAGNIGGGGGGAGAVGTTSGGNGSASSISGASVTYAGGGGGGGNGVTGGSGGTGGGGAGANGSVGGVAGTANTGGGGGGGGYNTLNPAAGGSGIVIISYPGSTQQMAGGTVTVAGGNVIHTFTSSGYLTPIVLVNNSLRFRASASAYLSRTPASTTNQRTFTWSGWVKRGALGGSNAQYIFSARSANNDSGWFSFFFNINDTLGVGGWSLNYRITSQLFRDPSAWYHLVLAVDTTQATASNRIKVYVNGSEVTAFSTTNNPTQNFDYPVNSSSAAHSHGSVIGYSPTYNFDGYMTDINFIDGQALTPNSFGTSNGLGVWQPIRYGGSYGTNGFYLKFTDTTSTTTLGYDSSPNSNNWTTNNISLTAGSTYDSMTDVPTLTSATAANYAVMNPLEKTDSNTAVLNGNLTAQGYLTGGTDYRSVKGTMYQTEKFYFEATIGNTGSSADWLGQIGIANSSFTCPLGTRVGGNANSWALIIRGGANEIAKLNNNVSTQLAAGLPSVGDVIMIACDPANGKVWFGRNGTWYGSGDPAAGTNAAFTNVSSSVTPAAGMYYSYDIWNTNFGQRPFAYTPPTGFVRLNTFNLPTPTIGATASTQANKYFDALLYTGNGSASQRTDISWANMQPDMVWIKNRTSANNHVLHDDVRGTNAALQPNLTNATDSPVGFGTDGFGFDGVSNQLRIFTSDGRYNTNGNAYVTWGWKGSGAVGSTNTAGTITSTVSANTSAGFSIATLTTQSSGTGTFGHGLGVAPSMVICKYRSTTSNWFTWHTAIAGTSYLTLNTTDGSTSNSAIFSAAPTSTVVNLGTAWGGSGQIVAYCFAQIAGYSAFGSYTGNGSSDGTFVFTGFRPRFIMVKNSSNAGYSWLIWDSVRETYNVEGSPLFPNLSNAEGSVDVTNYGIDFVSNGFKIRATGAAVNNSGHTYIYMAFAEFPFRYSLAR